MAKAKDIQINQSMPIVPMNAQTNSTTTGSQNTVPVSTHNTPSNYNVNTDPLWKRAWEGGVKPYIQASVDYAPSNLLTKGVTNVTKSALNATPEVKPVDAVEETAGGWNYGLDRSVSQTDNQQGHYNALNGTGHVVGMPEGQVTGLSSSRKGKTMPKAFSGALPEEETPTEQVIEQTPAATPTVHNTAKQPSVSPQSNAFQPQEVTQPEGFRENGVWYENATDRNNKTGGSEFGGLKGGESIEEVEQKVQNNEQALANMEADLNQSTAGRLYGKVTADQSTTIRTLQDDNSVYRSMNESRISTFKDLQTMDNGAIAAAIISNAMASDSQAMRDLMQYDPAKYQEVQQQIKQLKGQMTINSITNGDTYPTFNNGNAITNQISDFAASNSNSSTSTADILKNVNSSLNSNEAASTASETMASIESDMAVLQNRLKNLKKEASTVFKGDVPQYIVNAYISNRTAEIQDQMSILENRYNSAQSRYQQEWERTKWAAEFDLKKQELQLKRESANLDDWSTRQGIALKWAALNGTTNGVTPLTTLSVQESMNILSDFSSSYANNSYGGQCGTFVKRYLSQLGVNLPNVSSIDSKMSLIDPNITEANNGDVIIMTSTKYPNNGHMAIVESVDDDGTLHLLESNWDNDELVHRRTVSPNDKSILGYYRPTGGTSSGTSGSYDGYYNPNYGEIYGKFLQGKYSAGKQLETTAKSLGISVDELRAQANAWKADQTNSEEAMDMIDKVEYLLNNVLNGGLTRLQRQTATSKLWMVDDIDTLFSSGAGDYATAYKFVKDNITFNKLLDLKKNGATFGALSDNELRAIGNAATSLSTNQSTDEYIKTLLSIYNGLRNGIGERDLTLDEFRNGGGGFTVTDDMITNIFS